MRFTINSNAEIAATEQTAETAVDSLSFASVEELSALAQQWPMTRLVQMWNRLPAQRPVSRFTDRKTAVQRIWRAVAGAHGGHTQAQPRAVRSSPGGKLALARPGSKSARVIALLRRSRGATLSEIIEVTQWQPHSIRGFISGSLVTKFGLTVSSSKRSDGERAYRIVRG